MLLEEAPPAPPPPPPPIPDVPSIPTALDPAFPWLSIPADEEDSGLPPRAPPPDPPRPPDAAGTGKLEGPVLGSDPPAPPPNALTLPVKYVSYPFPP